MTPPPRGTDGPEREARARIDSALEPAGWVVQDRAEMNLGLWPRPRMRATASRGSTGAAVDVCVVRLGASPVSNRWLMYTINSPSVRADVAGLQSGSTRKRISKGNLLTVRLPVPPAPEQARIVDALETHLTRLDAAVAALERVQANLKRYRASVLKAAVEGRLVPTEAELARREGRDYEPASVLLQRILAERQRRWEEAELGAMKAKGKAPKDDKWKAKYEEPVAPDATGLPELPQGWCWTRLPYLGELNRGKSKHRPRNDPRLFGGPYPFIQTGEVGNAETFIRQFESTYSEFGLRQSRLWPAGTLCITIAANIAETAILTFDACFPDSVVGFVAFADDTLVRFIEIFLGSAQERLEQYAPATAQKNINLQVLGDLAIPLPPAREQKRIVDEYDRVMSVARSEEQGALTGGRRCNRLRQSILKWAFEGKLVDQDPNDEPASVLLERIRAEREVNGRTRINPERAPSSVKGRARKRRARASVANAS